jgi:transposase-like protein
MFKGFRFPPEITVLAIRWYPRYGLSCRDVEELLGERGIEAASSSLSPRHDRGTTWEAHGTM